MGKKKVMIAEFNYFKSPEKIAGPQGTCPLSAALVVVMMMMININVIKMMKGSPQQTGQGFPVGPWQQWQSQEPWHA